MLQQFDERNRALTTNIGRQAVVQLQRSRAADRSVPQTVVSETGGDVRWPAR